MAFSRLNINTTSRYMTSGGAFDADIFNDLVDELVTDLNSISDQWNNQLLPLSSLIPDGVLDSDINAFIHGLDSRYLFVDSTATDEIAIKARYYNTGRQRPNTVKEQLDTIYSILDNLDIGIDQVTVSSSTSGSGLTDEEKARIGINIFDSSQTSSTSSLDGIQQQHAVHLNKIITFVGQTDSADSTPDYSSENYISDGDSLQTAIGKLDTALANAIEFVDNTDIAIVTTDTASISVTAIIYYILVNYAGVVTINLPSIPVDTQLIKIKDISGEAGLPGRVITIDGNGKDIDGESSIIINSNYQNVSIIFSEEADGWFII